jgi:hypothetical protein
VQVEASFLKYQLSYFYRAVARIAPMVTVHMRILVGLIICIATLALQNTIAQENLVPEVSSWNSPYSAQLASAGVVGKVFPSRDRKIRYFFVEDSRNRIFLSCAEIAGSPVCSMGLRTQYLDVEGMDSPLLEYGFQIPEPYGGKEQSRYQLNWNWVRRLPIVRYYYSSTGQSVPDAP